MTKLVNPKNNQQLLEKPDGLYDYQGKIVFPKVNGVFKFLDDNDIFYEGAYKNSINYIPKIDVFPFNFPLFMINNGYLWEVKNHIPKGQKVIELGCASGVEYFGSRYEMLGCDLSFSSLALNSSYKYRLQIDATKLPFEDNSIDAVISSYFWEHIPKTIKSEMLDEFYRILKKGGKIIFLYDVETNNSLIKRLKENDMAFYVKEFIDKDGHLGYETQNENFKLFQQKNFTVLKHFPLERTWVQSLSVYTKMKKIDGWQGRLFGLLESYFNKGPLFYFYNLFVRMIDITIGKFFHKNKGRICITVAQKKIK